MSDRKIYIEKMSAKLKEWDSEIQKLEAKAGMLKADVKDKYQTEINQLSNKRKETQAKLEEIKNSGKESWTDLKDGFESAWRSLDAALKQAVSRFK